jgi:hypothetical protein
MMTKKRIAITAGIFIAITGVILLLIPKGIQRMFPRGGPGKTCMQQTDKEAERDFWKKVFNKANAAPHSADMVRFPGTIDEARRVYHCQFLPLAVELDGVDPKIFPPIRPYPKDKYVPSVCKLGDIDALPKAIKDDEQRIVVAATAVGRLGVHIVKEETTPPVFWGTATLVAPDVVATTCHSLNSYVQNGDKLMSEGGNSSMVIDFQKDPKKYGKQYECEVTKLLKCSTAKGLDFALLQIEKDCKAIKDVKPLVLSRRNPDEVASVALVGYPDSTHFIDHDTRDVFDAEMVAAPRSGAVNPRKDYPFAKYVRAGAALKNNCTKNPNIFLHPSTTTVGESGGVLLDLTQGTSTDPLQIVAFHTCCATYFPEPKGVPPDPDLACAQVQRTFENQALKSWSVIQNPELCKALKDHNAPSLSCSKP